MTDKTGPGRPPAGPAGAKVRDLPRITLRLEPRVKRRLLAAAKREGRPAWRIAQEAIAAHLARTPDTTTPRHHDTTTPQP